MFSATALFLSGVSAFSLLVGVLVGICGVGGILIIPFLVYIGGIDIHTVIPACMGGFSLSAFVAVYAYARQGSIRWNKAVFLIIGAAPGAYAGSLTVVALPALALELIVIALVFVSAVRALRAADANGQSSAFEKVPSLVLIMLGLLVGYGSSVSGTGGPLLLVPALLLLSCPVRVAVGLSMAIQLAIAPFATVGHVMHGSIDWSLALPLGLAVSAGVWIGALIAHRISTRSVQRFVAGALLLSGAMMTFSYLQ